MVKEDGRWIFHERGCPGRGQLARSSTLDRCGGETMAVSYLAVPS